MVANHAGVFAGGVNAGQDRTGIAQVEREEFGHAAAVGDFVVFLKEFFLAGAEDDGVPVFLAVGLVEALEVEEKLEVDLEQTGDVFGALDVAAHPIEGVRDAGEHHVGLWAGGRELGGGHGKEGRGRFGISGVRCWIGRTVGP